MDSKEKLTKELTEKVQNLNEMEKLEELVGDNSIKFTVNEKKYKVSKSTNFQNKEIRKARTVKFYELLKDDTYKLKETLIAELKEKGYDVIAKEQEIKEIGYSIEDIQIKLAPVPTENKEIIATYKNEIKELENKQRIIAERINELMEFSIEQELLSFSNLFLIYSVLEKEEDKWLKCFKTYEDFLASNNEELILSATYNMSMLVFSSKI